MNLNTIRKKVANNAFKVGDIIECMNLEYGIRKLIIGKQYKVISCSCSLGSRCDGILLEDDALCYKPHFFRKVN